MSKPKPEPEYVDGPPLVAAEQTVYRCTEGHVTQGARPKDGLCLCGQPLYEARARRVRD